MVQLGESSEALVESERKDVCSEPERTEMGVFGEGSGFEKNERERCEIEQF